MDVGFTGTERGMTTPQKERLTLELRRLRGRYFHHGDCIGSDEEAQKIALVMGLKPICHPPIDPKKRAFTKKNFRTWREKDYRARNIDIVHESDLIMATPGSFHEEFRGSGTWMTIRLAGKADKSCWIIFPDGSMKVYREDP